MFKLQDIRKTRVWQEARAEGMQQIGSAIAREG
jgi:predicted transposase YdaD